MFVLVTKRMF